jgi:thymidylate synthase
MGEQQYLDLIKDIINNGEHVKGRNGNTLTVFGRTMRFSLTNDKIPLLTSKKMAWKTCLKELLWFIHGKTDNKILKENKVNIWSQNGSREYLDSIGLNDREEDDLGPIYGHQWRHFNAPYTTCNENYDGKGIDQLSEIINSLKDSEKRYSRRLIMSAWNPCQLKEMALPPCHVLAQFNVINNKLSCALYQRSCDLGLGVPFNILSYSILTHLIAKHCDLEVGEFVYFMGNVHIYDDHIETLSKQTTNEIHPFPTIKIANKYENIEDYKLEDFLINNYITNDKVIMKMRT